MKAKFSIDDLPLCPDCEQPMDFESSKGRDTQTMGGLKIDFFTCECGKFKLIDLKELHPA